MSYYHEAWPYEQLLQRLVEHHHTRPVRQRRFGSRNGGRFGWRWVANYLPLGLGSGFFVLNAMREPKFEYLLAQLVHNLTTTTQTSQWVAAQTISQCAYIYQIRQYSVQCAKHKQETHKAEPACCNILLTLFRIMKWLCSLRRDLLQRHWFVQVSPVHGVCLTLSTLFLTWAGVPIGKPRRNTMQGALEMTRTR